MTSSAPRRTFMRFRRQCIASLSPDACPTGQNVVTNILQPLLSEWLAWGVLHSRAPATILRIIHRIILYPELKSERPSPLTQWLGPLRTSLCKAPTPCNPPKGPRAFPPIQTHHNATSAQPPYSPARVKNPRLLTAITHLDKRRNRSLKTPLLPPSSRLIRQNPRKRPAPTTTPVLQTIPSPPRWQKFFN